MPKVVDADEKRQEIMAAAVAVFATHGYRGTNLARVARAAGMAKSSLYHYFPTREALFAAIVDHTFRNEETLFEAAASGQQPPSERLRALVRSLTRMFEGWAAGGQLIIDFLGEERGRARLRETLRIVRRAVARIVRDGQRAGQVRGGSPDALAMIVVGCLDGLFLQELIEPGCTRGAARGRLLQEVLAAALRAEDAP